jgi:hypothetical protein
MRKKKVSIGKINISAEDFQDRNVTSAISIRVPLDILKMYRAKADELGIGYQTLMVNSLREGLTPSILRSHGINSFQAFEDIVDEIVQEKIEEKKRA